MKNKREIIESKYPPRNNEDIWLKDLLLYASTTKGWLPLGSEKTYSNKTELLKDTPTGGTIGIDKETGTAYLYNDVSKEWTPVGGGMTETTWKELKDKRDSGQLIPGSLYRITDYNCTTTQENTQSAGHQFDIVLLALSENKLAEEGWAMMNESNIWDITFTDGVKKCYVTKGDTTYTIVLVDTLMGLEDILLRDVDEQNKTASYPNASTALDEEDDFYNYFQNSNLSAWKVWYCLDNDKSRFSWADDSVDEDVPAELTVNDKGEKLFVRNTQGDTIRDNVTYYQWVQLDNSNNTRYTTTETPTINDTLYGNTFNALSATILSFTPAHEGTGLPNGRGVIYRLIDEWGNDVAYDFKNIQFKRPMTDGEYDPDNGEPTWVYTYTQYDSDNNILIDTSLSGRMMDGFVGIYKGLDSIYELSNNVILNPVGYSIKLVGIKSGYCTISNSSGLLLYNCDALDIDEVDDAIYIGGKKVLTEE